MGLGSHADEISRVPCLSSEAVSVGFAVGAGGDRSAGIRKQGLPGATGLVCEGLRRRHAV